LPKETVELHEVANALDFQNYIFVAIVSGLLCNRLFLYEIPYLTIEIYQWCTFKAHLVISAATQHAKAQYTTRRAAVRHTKQQHKQKIQPHPQLKL
jgi:hypothetical protein